MANESLCKLSALSVCLLVLLFLPRRRSGGRRGIRRGSLGSFQIPTPWRPFRIHLTCAMCVRRVTRPRASIAYRPVELARSKTSSPLPANAAPRGWRNDAQSGQCSQPPLGKSGQRAKEEGGEGEEEEEEERKNHRQQLEPRSRFFGFAFHDGFHWLSSVAERHARRLAFTLRPMSALHIGTCLYAICILILQYSTSAARGLMGGGGGGSHTLGRSAGWPPQRSRPRFWGIKAMWATIVDHGVHTSNV